MTKTRAADVLSSDVIRVDGESRPADVLQEIRARRAHFAAVFDGERNIGLLPLQDILYSSTERIFADLLPEPLPPAVPPETPIDELEDLLFKTDLDAVPVVTEQGRFVGVVSRQGLLNSKLDEKQRLLKEAQRLQSSAEYDRDRRRAALGASLTEREREVFSLILDGEPTKRIARQLGIAFSTAKNHRTSIYRKLGVGNVLELISLLSPAYDIRDGVLNVRQAVDTSKRDPNPLV
jgi:DNA-binding CsgD family transcriptional regulator/CBS domain-containing protein